MRRLEAAQGHCWTVRLRKKIGVSRFGIQFHVCDHGLEITQVHSRTCAAAWNDCKPSDLALTPFDVIVSVNGRTGEAMRVELRRRVVWLILWRPPGPIAPPPPPHEAARPLAAGEPPAASTAMAASRSKGSMLPEGEWISHKTTKIIISHERLDACRCACVSN